MLYDGLRVSSAVNVGTVIVAVPITPSCPTSHVARDQLKSPPVSPNEPRTHRPLPSKRRYHVAARGVPVVPTVNDVTSVIVSTLEETVPHGFCIVPVPITTSEPLYTLT